MTHLFRCRSSREKRRCVFVHTRSLVWRTPNETQLKGFALGPMWCIVKGAGEHLATRVSSPRQTGTLPTCSSDATGRSSVLAAWSLAPRAPSWISSGRVRRERPGEFAQGRGARRGVLRIVAVHVDPGLSADAPRVELRQLRPSDSRCSGSFGSHGWRLELRRTACAALTTGHRVEMRSLG